MNKKWTVFLWKQYKPIKANNMKYFNERNFYIMVFAVTAAVKRNHKFGLLQASFLIAALLINTAVWHQLRNLTSPDHESGGLLFGRLESLYGCAEWANYNRFCVFRERIERDDSSCSLTSYLTMSSLRPLLSAHDFPKSIYVSVVLIEFLFIAFYGELLYFLTGDFPESYRQFFWIQKQRRNCVQYCHGNLVLSSILAVIPLLHWNNDTVNQSNLLNFSIYIIICGNVGVKRNT